MQIQAKLSKIDFVFLTFTLLLRRLQVRVLVFILIALIISGLTAYFGFGVQQAVQLVLVTCVFALVFAFMIYQNAGRVYAMSARMQAGNDYIFSSSGFQLSSNGDATTYSWSKIECVSKNKRFILIWENRHVAHVLLRRTINSDQYQQLERFISGKNVKNNL